MHGAGSSSPTSVTIEAGAIVVSGVSSPDGGSGGSYSLAQSAGSTLGREQLGAGRSL